MLAGALHVGEPVREADGKTAIVVRLRVVPGAASMWDLTVSNVHTFAVGSGAFVVHNCGGPDPEGAMAELKQMRDGLTSGAGDADNVKVLSKLEVGDQSFYGINASGTPNTFGFPDVNFVSPTHAEGDVFLQAKNAGVSAKEGFLYVDKDLCSYCRRADGVPAMARAIGLDRITVFTPSFMEGRVWDL